MKQELTINEHWTEQGNPAGGVTCAPGLCISWQNGPLGRDAARREPNGCFVETVIEAARERLLFYQGTRFRCDENGDAISHLEPALAVLQERTERREAVGVEGTHAGT